MVTFEERNSTWMTENLNVVKELLLLGLADDGVLTKEECDYYKKYYAIIAAKPSWLGKEIGKDYGEADFGFFLLRNSGTDLK